MLATYAGYGVGVLLWLGLSSLTGFSLGSILLFVLFVTHALVGAVELGTDGWIQNITGNILSSEQGKYCLCSPRLSCLDCDSVLTLIEKNIGLSPVGLVDRVCGTRLHRPQSHEPCRRILHGDLGSYGVRTW